jgi:hypothetical protein
MGDSGGTGLVGPTVGWKNPTVGPNGTKFQCEK